MRHLALMLLTILPQNAAAFEIIIDRREQAIELFIALPADEAEVMLGVDPAKLEGLTTGIDFKLLSQGTWLQGDALVAGIQSTIGLQPVQFESMSMMVHPRELVLPFSHPIDGMNAITVCGIEAPDVPYDLSEMMIYLGLIAYPVPSEADIELRFPNQASTKIKVNDYSITGLKDHEFNLQPNGAINIAAPKTFPYFLVILTCILLTAVLAVGGMLLSRKYIKAPVDEPRPSL